MPKPVNERIIFRLIHTPCCHTLLCWVNPRLPNVCPECGERIYAKLKTGDHIITSSEGWLRIADYDFKGTWAEYNELVQRVKELEERLSQVP